MPKIAAKFDATNPLTQAMTLGLAAPSLVWQPGGTRAQNVYPTENLLQSACTDATVGMTGPFPLYLDCSLSADSYTTAADLDLGGAYSLVGVVNQADGEPPALLLPFTLSPPVEIRDVAFQGQAASGQTFTSNPQCLRLTGQTVATSTGLPLYAANDAGGTALGYLLEILEDAVCGDGTNPVLDVGAAGVVTCYVRGFGNLTAGAIVPNAGCSVNIVADASATVDPSYPSLPGVTVTVLGGGSALPAPPGSDGFYRLLIAASTATWAADYFPVAPADGTYQLTFAGGLATFTAPTANTSQNLLIYPGVFASWAGLVAAAHALTSPIIIPQPGNYTIPAGAWNLDSGGGWSINCLGLGATFAFVSGASVTTLPTIITGIVIESVSASPIYSGTNNSIEVVDGALFGSSTSDLIHYTGSAAFNLTLDGSSAQPAGGHAVISGTASCTVLNVAIARGGACLTDALNFTSAAMQVNIDDVQSLTIGAQNVASTKFNAPFFATTVLSGATPFSISTPTIGTARVTSGSTPTGATTFTFASFGPFDIDVDLTGVDMHLVTALTFAVQGGAASVTVPTPGASAVYRLWFDGVAYMAVQCLTPGVEAQAPTTTAGTVTMGAPFVGYPVDTSGGNTNPVLKFPASPFVGQTFRPCDVGMSVLNGTGAALNGWQLQSQGGGASFFDADAGKLVTSKQIPRNGWSQLYSYTAKGIWSAQ